MQGGEGFQYPVVIQVVYVIICGASLWGRFMLGIINHKVGGGMFTKGIAVCSQWWFVNFHHVPVAALIVYLII